MKGVEAFIWEVETFSKGVFFSCRFGIFCVGVGFFFQVLKDFPRN